MYVFDNTNSPDVQSINHTSGYIDTYLFMPLVEMESITNILVSSCKEKSFCSSRIYSFRKSEHFNFWHVSESGRLFVRENNPLPVTCMFQYCVGSIPVSGMLV